MLHPGSRISTGDNAIYLGYYPIASSCLDANQWFDLMPTSVIISPADVVRHFLKLEASRPKYASRAAELMSWCKLPAVEVMCHAKDFALQRDDVNPTLVYTVGIGNDNRNTKVACWTKERIKCTDVFTSGISPQMRSDIDAARGNLPAFAQTAAHKYPEFCPLSNHSDIQKTIIVVAHSVHGKDGHYEAIDGAHRLVAMCRSGIPDVDAYVAHMQ